MIGLDTRSHLSIKREWILLRKSFTTSLLSYGKIWTSQGHFWALFGSQNWPFSLKNQVFGHFPLNCTSDLSKNWSETGDSCFESLNGSVVSGKILVLAALAIFGSKYMACGGIWFWAVFGHFLPNRRCLLPLPWMLKPASLYFCWYMHLMSLLELSKRFGSGCWIMCNFSVTQSLHSPAINRPWTRSIIPQLIE